MFFLVFLEFFCFFLVYKKKLVFFVFGRKSLLKKGKKQKNSRFFGFFMDCSYMYSKHLTKKNKKTMYFLVFKNLNQKKTKKTQGKPKKTSFGLKPKLLQKVLVFCFFGFLEVL